MPLIDILATHTEGQLTLMAFASQILYNTESDSYEHNRDSHIEEYVKPKKPLSQMTMREVEEYYMYAGFTNG